MTPRVSIFRRWLLAALVLGFFLVSVELSFSFVQRRIWNYLGATDLLVMAALIAPFLAIRWVSEPRSRWTTAAWWLCALMALDVLAFAVGILAPTGGHPSLEAVASFFLAFGKVVLVPAALLSLVVASLRGERTVTILLGTICLVGETLYSVAGPDHPIAWFVFIDPAGT